MHSDNECGEESLFGSCSPSEDANIASVNSSDDDKPLAELRRPLHVFVSDAGELRQYRDGRMIAYCTCPAHVGRSRCRLTAQTKPWKRQFTPNMTRRQIVRAELDGRCIGYSYAFLRTSKYTPEKHPTQKSHVHDFKCARLDRQICRSEFYALPGSQDFALAVERPLKPGESDEP